MFICRGQIWWLDVAAAALFPFLFSFFLFFFCARRCVCLRVCISWSWCVLSLTDAGLWEMPACRVALNQTHIGSDTAEPAVWQACDRAELGLNDFLGSITLPKHWTRHLPFPISPSWSQSPFLFANGALIAPLPLAQYRLITHRCKLARTRMGQPPTTANQRGKPSGALSARGRPAAVVIILKEASVVGIYTATLASDVLTLAARSKSESASRGKACWRWPKTNVSLAETQISGGQGGGERVKGKKKKKKKTVVSSGTGTRNNNVVIQLQRGNWSFR